ncbi:MAG: hypothetical protein ACLVJH_15020 [Faecalibacterium prausnitzii]
MILVRNIRLPLSAAEPQAFEKALHTLRVPRSKVEHTGVAKLSVDARHGQPKLVYRGGHPQAARGGGRICGPLFGRRPAPPGRFYPARRHPAAFAPPCGVWTGAPAGLFATLLLARQGTAPSCWSAALRWMPVCRRWSTFPPPVSWTPTPTSSSARAARAPSRMAS